MSNKVLKAGIGYTISNILLRGIGILTLPIFTRLLTTGEYGQYSIFMSYATIMLTVISCALHTSVRSANLLFPGKINSYVSSVTLIYLFNMGVFLLLSVVAPQSVCKLIGLNRLQMGLLSIYCFSTTTMTLYNTRLSLDYKVKLFFVLSVFNAVGSVVFALILMLTIFRNNHLLGRLLGQVIVAVIVSTIILTLIYRAAPPRPRKEYYSFGLKYSAPLIAHGISQTALAQIDKIMINSIAGENETGIYSFAGSTKTILLVVQSAVNTVWATWFFERMAEGGFIEIKRKGMEYAILICFLTIGALGISPEVIKILGPREFWDARYIAIPMVLDSFLIFMYGVVVQAEYYTQKTQYILFGTIIASAINIFTNYFFIKRYGYIAAAYTTLFSYVLYLLLHVAIAKHLIGFHIVSIKTIVFQFLTVFSFGAICLLTVDMLFIRWLLTLLCSGAVGLLLLKFVSQDNSMSIKELLIVKGKAIKAKLA